MPKEKIVRFVMTFWSATAVAALVSPAAAAADARATPATTPRAAGSAATGTALARNIRPDSCGRSWHRGKNAQVEVITNGTPQIIGGTTWTDLACGSATVQVPKGTVAHLTVWVNAEIRCKGPGDSGWCGGRILVDGQSLRPGNEDGKGDFAWDTAEPGAWRWHSGSMIRAGVVRCPADNATANCDKKVTVQVVSPNTNTDFWVDDTLVRAELIRES
ncbi:hypothetical protein GCM10017673_56130 [Streptosporangium violaceochromogenes]|nr:hypothetical protein GCM10017673_56130 [Streptosporangium violaceochromogenes]